MSPTVLKQNRIATWALLIWIAYSALSAQPIDSSAVKQDSISIKSFWIPSQKSCLQSTLTPFAQDQISFGLQYQTKPARKHSYYDIRRVLPENSMFIDLRESSYYTPLMVEDKLAAAMNRPKPGEVWPVFTAEIAASLVFHYIEIENKTAIAAQNYILADEYIPVMQVLWQKSPQTVAEIYRQLPVASNRTYPMLETQLNFLVDRKIVKINRPDKAPALYYAAQPKPEVERLLKDALEKPENSPDQKQQIQVTIAKIKASQ
jgi:predicted transcriptional regulator